MLRLSGKGNELVLISWRQLETAVLEVTLDPRLLGGVQLFT